MLINTTFWIEFRSGNVPMQILRTQAETSASHSHQAATLGEASRDPRYSGGGTQPGPPAPGGRAPAGQPRLPPGPGLPTHGAGRTPTGSPPGPRDAVARLARRTQEPTRAPSADLRLNCLPLVHNLKGSRLGTDNKHSRFPKMTKGRKWETMHKY